MRDFYGSNRTPDIRVGNAPMTGARAFKIALAAAAVYALYRIAEIIIAVILTAGYFGALYAFFASLK